MNISDIAAAIIKFCSGSADFTQCVRAFKDIDPEKTVTDLRNRGLLTIDPETLTDEEYGNLRNVISILSGEPRAVAYHLADNCISRCIEEECEINYNDFREIIEKFFLPDLPKDLRTIVVNNIGKDVWDSVRSEFAEACKNRLESVFDGILYLLEKLGLIYTK